MDGKHPKNADPRPKRRRDKDNPYELFTTGLGTAQPRYYLAFVDSTGTEQCMEIDKALFDVFDRFELEDISFMVIPLVQLSANRCSATTCPSFECACFVAKIRI